MSVTVRHLNADSSFHLIFSPEPHPQPCDLRSANGAYSILIDPWLVGSSITTAPWFAITYRVVPSAIQHLSELEDEPDVVVCSQNKADHTNKDTLLQLRPEGKTIIVAEPGAAKAIKSWHHFDPNRVHSMSKYDPKARFGNSLRLYIPPLSPEGHPGEVNITFIPAKNYMTGLHNAFGITYQAPTRTKTLAPVSTIDLPRTRYFHLPLSPVSPQLNSPPRRCTHNDIQSPILGDRSEETLVLDPPTTYTNGHRPKLSRSINTESSELLSFGDKPTLKRSIEDLPNGKESSTIKFSNPTLLEPFSFSLPTPPMSPNINTSTPISPQTTSSTNFTHRPSTSSTTPSSIITIPYHKTSPSLTSNKSQIIHPARPKAISVLYMPHGLSLQELKPYIQNHLVPLPGALPLTLLLHAFNHTQNPWYFGGNIMTGAAGGMDIAKSLMARCWISAHDELKDDRGVAVKLLKLRQAVAEDIRRELLTSDDGNKSSGWVCDVRSLGVGKEVCLSSDTRDMCVGFETTGPVPLSPNSFSFG